MKKLSITLLVFAFLQCFGYAQTTLPFSEDWESGSFATNGWTVTNGDGFAVLNNSGVAGSKGLAMGFAKAHTGSQPVSIQSPWISVKGEASGMLALSLRYKFNNPDSARWILFRIFNDTGQGWQLMNEFSYYGNYGWRDYKNLIRCNPNGSVRIKLEIQPDTLNMAGTWHIDALQLADLSPLTYAFPVTAEPKTSGNTPAIEASWNEPQLQSGTLYQSDTLKFPYDEWWVMDCWEMDSIYAHGIIFPIDSPANPLLLGMEFMQAKHPQEPAEYRHRFKLYLVDWDTKVFLDTLGPFLTNSPSEWVTQIPLNLACYPNTKNLGVFISLLDLVFDPHGGHFATPLLKADSYTLGSYMILLTPTPVFYLTPTDQLLFRLLLLNPVTGKVEKISGHKPSSTPTYNLYRWQESLPLNYTIMNATPITDTAYLDTDVEKGWYSYFVEASYPNQQVLYSDTTRAYMPTSAGAGTMDPAQVSLYPNPATNSLYVKSAQPMAGISVFNGQGQLVAESMLGTATETVLQLGSFAPGLYVARLRFANGSVGSSTFVKE